LYGRETWSLNVWEKRRLWAFENRLNVWEEQRAKAFDEEKITKGA
jgi:hypothetical protein